MSDFERDVRAVHTAGQGAMTLTVVGPASAASIINAVMEGDVAARVVLSAADRLLRQIERRSQARALSCALCDNGVLWHGQAPYAVAVLQPFGLGHAPAAIGLGFCGTCAAGRRERELVLAAVTKLRSNWMPDLRLLPVMAGAGHA